MLIGVVPTVVRGVVDVVLFPFADATRSLRAVPLPTKRTTKPARSIAREALLQTLDMGKEDMLEFLVVSLGVNTQLRGIGTGANLLVKLKELLF
jgi:hypothetical protein